MSALIVYLPTAASGAVTEYRYAQTRDGQSVLAQGSASATALPLTGVASDVVAVVPGRMLSWHEVELPKGALTSGAVRLRAVLEGLLEDRLLDEPQNLHFAIAPAPSADTSPNQFWVAACDKSWLQAALAPLEAAARPVSRIVPEFAPHRSGSPDEDRVYAVGEADDAWLVHSHRQGVTMFPLQPAAVAQWQAARPSATDAPTGASDNKVLAEPAVAGLANTLFHDRVRLQQAPERWVLALQSDWDLAQFDLANSGRQRAFKKLGNLASDMLHTPRWRAARWGAVLLVIANLVGLNAWAWKEKAKITQKRSEVQSVLTQTFPQVKVVIDAPVQMSREVVLLRHSVGATSRQDLESLLTALGSVLPSQGDAQVRQIDYAENELRLRGGFLKDRAMPSWTPQLQTQGYTAQLDGDALSIKPAAEAAMPVPGVRP